ncbi:RIO kinase 1 [Apostasia shenzhenica]|uniref:RIO kinase 1 n=1 Tax=Apostasia shenzhenica TaxID=1088818 RepID=A0A2I0AI59_9ASPA|nr:RIO kinase 1 [Apostasia shenzhenica]
MALDAAPSSGKKAQRTFHQPLTKVSRVRDTARSANSALTPASQMRQLTPGVGGLREARWVVNPEEWDGRMNVGMSNSVTTAIRETVREAAIGRTNDTEKAYRASVEQLPPNLGFLRCRHAVTGGIGARICCIIKVKLPFLIHQMKRASTGLILLVCQLRRRYDLPLERDSMSNSLFKVRICQSNCKMLAYVPRAASRALDLAPPIRLHECYVPRHFWQSHSSKQLELGFVDLHANPCLSFHTNNTQQMV